MTEFQLNRRPGWLVLIGTACLLGAPVRARCGDPRRLTPFVPYKNAGYEQKVVHLRGLIDTHDFQSFQQLLCGLRELEELGNVREAAAEVLGLSKYRESIPELKHLLDRPDMGSVRAEILLALYRLGDSSAVGRMREFLTRPFPDADDVDLSQSSIIDDAAGVARVVGRADIQELSPEVERLLESRSGTLAGSGCMTLADLKIRSAAPKIQQLLGDTRPFVSNYAKRALDELGAVAPENEPSK